MEFRKISSKTAVKELLVLLILVGISILIRWSTILFPASQSWDEDTFLLVGSRTATGELPFTTTIENKPPLATLLHAVPFFVHISHPTIIKLFCSFLIGASAFFLTKFASNQLTSFHRIVLGSMYLVLYTFFPGGESWLIEVNVIFIFSVSFYLLDRVKRNGGLEQCLLLGFFTGSVPWTRTNWLLVSIVITVVAFVYSKSRQRQLFFLLGLLSPTVSIVLLYFLSGELGSLWKGTISLPLDLSSYRNSFFEVSRYMLIFFFLSFLLLVVSAIQKKYLKDKSDTGIEKSLFLMMIALVLMQAFQYPDFLHHTLQILPFFLVSVTLVWLNTILLLQERAIAQKLFNRMIRVSFVLAIGLAVSANFISVEHSKMLWHEQDRLTAKLKAYSSLEDNAILAFSDHYVYWRLGVRPFVPLVTHPSSLVKKPFIDFVSPRLYPEEVVENLFSNKPRFVIFDSSIWYLDKSIWYSRTAVRSTIKRKLSEDYYVADADSGKLFIRTS